MIAQSGIALFAPKTRAAAASRLDLRGGCESDIVQWTLKKRQQGWNVSKNEEGYLYELLRMAGLRKTLYLPSNGHVIVPFWHRGILPEQLTHSRHNRVRSTFP
jgi:hypothetical protein